MVDWTGSLERKSMAYQISFLDGAPSPRVRQKRFMISKKKSENYRRRAPEVTNSLLFRVFYQLVPLASQTFGKGSLKEGFGFQSRRRRAKPTTCQGGEGSQLNGLAFTKDPPCTFIGSRHPIVSWQYFPDQRLLLQYRYPPHYHHSAVSMEP